METKTRIRARSTDSKNEDLSILDQIKLSAIRLRDATISQTGQRRWFLQIAWLFIYIALITCLLSQCAKLIQTYLNYPTDIDIEIITKPQLEFPAVTVCNENPLRKSKIGRIREYEDLQLLDKYVMSSIQSIAEEVFEGEQPLSCGENYHRCNGSGTCIPTKWVCNGISNCADNSDESPFYYNCIDIQQRRADKITDEQGICAWPYIQCPGETYCSPPCAQTECHKKDSGFSDTKILSRCEVCESVLRADETFKEFTSKNYPSHYEANVDCKWTIQSSKESDVLLSIEDLQIEGTMGSCSDYLEVFDSNYTETAKRFKVGRFKKICDKKRPHILNFVSTNSVITVRFRTNSLLNERGFKMGYIAIPKSDLGETKNSEREVEKEPGKARRRDKTGRRPKRSDQSYENADLKGEDSELTPSEPKNQHSPTEEPRNENFYYWDETIEYHDTDSYAYYINHDTYENFVEKFDPIDQFYSVKPHDFYGLYKASKLSDFSDFRLAVLFSKNIILYNGHRKQDFIVQCTYDGRKCDANFFKTFQEPFYGNCFSFNSIRDQNTSRPWFIRSSSKTGQEFGLKLTFFLDTEEYLGLLAPTASVRAIIHDAKTRPLVRAQSFAVGAGEATFISLRMNVIERQGGKYSNCADYWPHFLKLNSDFSKKWPQYDEDTCFYFCVINTMTMRCNCTDSYEQAFSEDDHINNASQTFCNLKVESESRCRKSVYDDYRDNNLKCDCPHECETISFAQRQSSGPWPTKAYAPYFVSRMLESKSKRVIRYTKKMLTENQIDEGTLQRQIRENFARLEVFYEALNFQKISESSSYDVTALLSDFGGNLGLWLGWSVLILFEILQFVYECFEITIKGMFSFR